MRTLFATLLFCLCSSVVSVSGVQVDEKPGLPTSIKIYEHSLGELVIPSSLGAKSFRVDTTLECKQFETKAGVTLVFCGPPGEYSLRITYVTENYEIHVVDIRVTIIPKDRKQPEPKPDPKPKPEPDPKPKPTPPPEPTPKEKRENAINSVVKIRTQYSLCSATIVFQFESQVTLFTAAHCVSRQGQVFDVETRSGVKFQATVAAFDRKSDLAVLLAKYSGKLPYTPIARGYKLGEKVFHCGFGRHIPGNVEEGELISIGDYQNAYSLSVSPGDSGGGIFNADGEWMGAVCCTTNLDRVGTVWAGNVYALKRLWSEFEKWKTDSQDSVDHKKLELVKKFLVHVVASRIVIITDKFEVVLDHKALVDYVLLHVPEELLEDAAKYILDGGCVGFACDLIMLAVTQELCGCEKPESK